MGLDLIDLFSRVKNNNKKTKEEVEEFVSGFLGEDVDFKVFWVSHDNFSKTEIFNSDMNVYWLLFFIFNYKNIKNKSLCVHSNKSWFQSVYLLLVLSNVDGFEYDGFNFKLLSQKSNFNKYDIKKFKVNEGNKGLFRFNKKNT